MLGKLACRGGPRRPLPPAGHLPCLAAGEVRETTEPDFRFTEPLYTTREAARHVGVPHAAFVSWAAPREGEDVALVSAIGPTRGVSVPFVGLIEAFVLGSLRAQGVGTRQLRGLVATLRSDLGPHPLARRDLLTAGPTLLAGPQPGAPPGFTPLVDATSRRFRGNLAQRLACITHDEAGWARRLALPVDDLPLVEIDPARAFGQPLFVHGGARVEDLVDRFVAGDSISDVAADFGVPPEHLEAVLRASLRRAA